MVVVVCAIKLPSLCGCCVVTMTSTTQQIFQALPSFEEIVKTIETRKCCHTQQYFLVGDVLPPRRLPGFSRTHCFLKCVVQVQQPLVSCKCCNQ